MKVMYTGDAARIMHKGVFRHGRHNEQPMEFVRDMPVEVTDPEDQAMFQRMAEANPETWKIVDESKRLVRKKPSGE